jgi:asparagine synthase (glutamine-hydrolysing)
LRKWLEKTCPAAEPWARKQGFTVPVDAWIAPRAADLGARIADVRAVAEVRTKDAVLAAFREGSSERWPLLFFALWSLIHLEGATPAEGLERVAGPLWRASGPREQHPDGVAVEHGLAGDGLVVPQQQ